MYNEKSTSRLKCFLISFLSFGIHAAHYFSNLLFAWGSTHASEHCADHFFVDWWVFFKLFLEIPTRSEENDDATNDEHTDSEQ